MLNRTSSIVLAFGSVFCLACGKHDSPRYDANTSTSSPAAVGTTQSSYGAMDTAAKTKHHSKLAGAAVGAVAGHVMGGHAVAGAAAGALIQHERNKHGR